MVDKIAAPFASNARQMAVQRGLQFSTILHSVRAANPVPDASPKLLAAPASLAPRAELARRATMRL